MESKNDYSHSTKKKHGCFLIFDDKNEILVDTLTPNITGLELHVLCERYELAKDSQYISINDEEALELMGGHAENPFDSPLRKKAKKVRKAAKYVSNDWQSAENDILNKIAVLCKNLSTED